MTIPVVYLIPIVFALVLIPALAFCGGLVYGQRIAFGGTDYVPLKDVQELVDQMTLNPVATRARFIARHEERLARLNRLLSD